MRDAVKRPLPNGVPMPGAFKAPAAAAAAEVRECKMLAPKRRRVRNSVMEATVTNLDAGSAGTIELNDAIFGLEPRKDLLHRMVRYQQLKRMAGTHHAQDRSEVNVTTRKFMRQKGSGGARHRTKSVPQFRGGGKAFGPKPRSHAIDLPKKVRALALAPCVVGKSPGR